MQKTIEVVYGKGVFKPLEPVELKEGEKIKFDISRSIQVSNPNDALIAATCKHYGKNKIATFDPDFERLISYHHQ
jgi:predicted DNA-binding antitoxin AbrB/MazE fold protein